MIWEIRDLEERARSRITAEFYDYVAGGSDDEWSLHENERAWERYVLRPKVLRDVRAVETSTTLLGVSVGSPIGIAPMAMQHYAWEDGALSTARRGLGAFPAGDGALRCRIGQTSRSREFGGTALAPGLQFGA